MSLSLTAEQYSSSLLRGVNPRPFQRLLLRWGRGQTSFRPGFAIMFETPLREEHTSQGAVLGTFFGGLLPERFTDFSKEYRLARDSVALLDTNYQAFLSFEGPDRVRYLNAVLTNNIQALATGRGCPSLLLNPQGHILADLECYALSDRLITISPAMVRERTAETLERFIIMDDVRLTDETDVTADIALEGPKASAIIRELGGLSLDALAEYSIVDAKLASRPCRIARRSHFGSVGAEIIVSRDLVVSVWRALLDASRAHGGGPVGYAALNALRLQAGIPWFSYDFDDTVIPQEAALENTHISFTKGCYTGQEIVERVRSRGHVNRRLVGLEFTSRTPPERGTKLVADGKEAGHVTSAAYSPAFARVIGMGYVRREFFSPGSQLECVGTTSKVVDLPFESQRMTTGKPAHS